MFYSHIKDTHCFTLPEYQEKYGSFYNHIRPSERTYHECKFCGDFILFDMSELDTHLKQAGHNIKNSDYIAKYCQEKKRGSKRKEKKALVEPEAKVLKSKVKFAESVKGKNIVEYKETSRTDTNIRKSSPFLETSNEEKVSSKTKYFSSIKLPEDNSVEKISNLGELSNFDLDALLKNIEKDPSSVSASDLLKAFEILVD